MQQSGHSHACLILAISNQHPFSYLRFVDIRSIDWIIVVISITVFIEDDNSLKMYKTFICQLFFFER